MKGDHSLPAAALKCPLCRYDLIGSTGENGVRCPECGAAFTFDELRMMNAPDLEGQPKSLSPHECRIPGQLWLLIFLSAALLALALIYAGASALGP